MHSKNNVDCSLINIYENSKFAKEIPSIWTDWYNRLDSKIMIIGQDWGPFEDMKKALDDLISSGLFALNGEEAVNYNQPNNEMLEDAKRLLLKNKDPKKQKSNKPFKLEGKIQGTKSDFAFLIPFDKTYPDVFISAGNLKGAINNDTVSVEVMGNRDNKNKRLEGRVLAILERGNTLVVGKIFIGKSNAMVMPDDVKFGKDILVPLSKLNGASDGDKVVVKVNKFYNDKKNPEGEISEVLGRPNEIETEVKAIIRSYNLYETFPNKVLEVAKTLPDEVDMQKYLGKRKDLTNINTFTIDGEDTRDIDDAISISKNSNGTYKLTLPMLENM